MTQDGADASERVYTLEEAVKVGGVAYRRALCASNEDGHQIALTVRQRNYSGVRVIEQYTCMVCDVIVHLEYPPLGR